MDQAHGRAQQRGLARTIGTDQHGGSAGGELQRDAAQQLRATDGDMHVLQRDRQFGLGMYCDAHDVSARSAPPHI
jgi:hypothetical protein